MSGGHFSLPDLLKVAAAFAMVGSFIGTTLLVAIRAANRKSLPAHSSNSELIKRCKRCGNVSRDFESICPNCGIEI